MQRVFLISTLLRLLLNVNYLSVFIMNGRSNQSKHLLCIILLIIISCALEYKHWSVRVIRVVIILVVGVASVSYTHLDVYKRQVDVHTRWGFEHQRHLNHVWPNDRFKGNVSPLGRCRHRVYLTEFGGIV